MATQKTITYITEWDTNDWDYISNEFDLTKYCKKNNLDIGQMEKRIEFFIEKIKNYKSSNQYDRHNWANDYSNETVKEMYPDVFSDDEWEFKEEWDFLYDMLPRGEYGIHTITSIICITGVKENLFTKE